MVDVHPALVPAWQALTGLRTTAGQGVGSSYLLVAEASGVRLTVGPLPDGADAGFDPRGRDKRGGPPKRASCLTTAAHVVKPVVPAARRR